MRAPTAAQSLAAIRANVAAMANGEITYDEFHARQCAAWDAIVARGERFHERVLKLWRTDAYGHA